MGCLFCVERESLIVGYKVVFVSFFFFKMITFLGSLLIYILSLITLIQPPWSFNAPDYVSVMYYVPVEEH